MSASGHMVRRWDLPANEGHLTIESIASNFGLRADDSGSPLRLACAARLGVNARFWAARKSLKHEAAGNALFRIKCLSMGVVVPRYAEQDRAVEG